MENTQKSKKNIIFLILLWMIQGIVVGFGAIVPGISGGALLAAFGMYKPIIELVSDIKNIKSSIKKYGLMLAVFIVGVGAGFVGLSGLAHLLMQQNTTAVVCTFVGFILGTVPDLWKDAGTEGRGARSYIALGVGFAVMLTVLALFKMKFQLTVEGNFLGYALCGVFWALSFIVPGLSSSTLIMYIGLYDPMLEGISTLNFSILIPMAVGGLLCLLLLAKLIGWIYKKQYAVISHAVLGIVVATAIMIYPLDKVGFTRTLINLAFVLGGAVLSFFFTLICNRIKEKNGL